MKKSLLPFLVLCMIVAPRVAVAQQGYVGLAAGPNFSNVKTDGLENGPVSEMRTKFVLGAVLGLRLADNLYVHSTPLYAQGGPRWAVLTDFGTLNMDIDLTYVEIPVFLKYEFGGRARPYIMAGPALVYMFDRTFTTTVQNIYLEGDAGDVLTRADWGVGLGLGLNYDIGPGVVFVEGRYRHGLSNIWTGGTVVFKAGDIVADTEVFPDTGEFKSRAYQLVVGITLPFGRR